MGKITYNEVIQAAKILNEYCISHVPCKRCMFYSYNLHQCSIIRPYAWNIPDPAAKETEDSKRMRDREEFFREEYK